jgi:hypothetical protein
LRTNKRVEDSFLPVLPIETGQNIAAETSPPEHRRQNIATFWNETSNIARINNSRK